MEKTSVLFRLELHPVKEITLIINTVGKVSRDGRRRQYRGTPSGWHRQVWCMDKGTQGT